MITAADFYTLIPDPSGSVCATWKKWLKLPITLYNLVNQILDSDGYVAGTVAIGDYIYSSAPLAETSSRKLANGQLLSKTTYSELWAKYGSHLYGADPGGDNFYLADHRGRFPVSVGTFTPDTGDPKTFTLAEEGGAAAKTIVEANIPPHKHVMSIMVPTGAGYWPADDLYGTGVSQSSGSVVDDTSDSRARCWPLTSGDETGSETPSAATAIDILNPYLGVYVYVRVK